VREIFEEKGQNVKEGIKGFRKRKKAQEDRKSPLKFPEN